MITSQQPVVLTSSSIDSSDEDVVEANVSVVDAMHSALLRAEEMSPVAVRSYCVDFYLTQALEGGFAQYLTEDALREEIRAAGFEVVDDDQASVQEWDVFEAGFRGRFTRWLEAHDADHRAAEQVRRQYEEQRAAYEEGYRGVLGMAYFCLRG
ncbi:hypothetical protein AB0N33_15660 [Pseudarthrobacter oxydans]|uniref:hypothetical protein n=1 Tax=Pseudarthrobacter oxydans TaxID=1671 RepID=UPI00342B1698